jgi:hypothetical protein
MISKENDSVHDEIASLNAVILVIVMESMLLRPGMQIYLSLYVGSHWRHHDAFTKQ